MAEDNLRAEAERLCALAEEHDKQATPGPWRSTWDEPHHETFDESVAVATSAPAANPIESIVVGTLWYDGLTVACRREDALFIAESRAGWPALAKVTRALLEENARLLDRVGDADAEVESISDEYCDELVELREENARLRGVVQQMADLDQVVEDGIECFLCSANGPHGNGAEHEDDCPILAAKELLEEIAQRPAANWSPA